MIRVIINLHVVEESDDAYWLTDCSPNHYLQQKIYFGNREDTMNDLCDRFGYVFRRVKKEEEVGWFIQDCMFTKNATIEQVSVWPTPIDLKLETQ
jgi:hypothetical protein